MSEPTASNTPPRWRFVLYTAGDKPAMQRAEASLRRMCDRYLAGGYVLSIIDVMQKDADVPSDVLAVPTVVRTSPLPERRVIGDLSRADQAAHWLGLTAAELLAKTRDGG